ncbi:hypothetical protein GCM10009548_22350 [Streptomyces malaysiensis subsp. malaysiensis]|uniref:GntR family transcriptional regulator n=1 Tax=Streptomyces malaysiensis TaxID=92644 RepID=A0A2J7YZ20_STRMQ|nr:hypothetical protein SMF913_28733 [Streptomyces malaysiensis]
MLPGGPSIRKAIAALRAEGLIEVIHGRALHRTLIPFAIADQVEQGSLTGASVALHRSILTVLTIANIRFIP